MKPCIAEWGNSLGWIVELTFCLWIELQAPVTSSAARHKKFGGASAPSTPGANTMVVRLAALNPAVTVERSKDATARFEIHVLKAVVAARCAATTCKFIIDARTPTGSFVGPPLPQKLRSEQRAATMHHCSFFMKLSPVRSAFKWTINGLRVGVPLPPQKKKQN